MPTRPARPAPRLRPLVGALLCTAVVALVVRATPHLPGDVALTRAVQALVPGTDWVAPFVSTATFPLKLALMAGALLGVWRLAGVRTAAVVLGVIALEQLLSDPGKALFGRPRPSPELVRVVGTHRGLSFPSSFVSTWSVTAGALVLVALRTVRTRGARAGVALAGVLLLLLVGAARVVPGAHWPSDVLGTALLFLGWVWAALSLVRRPS